MENRKMLKYINSIFIGIIDFGCGKSQLYFYMAIWHRGPQ